MKQCYPEEDDRCLNNCIATLECYISKGKSMMLPSVERVFLKVETDRRIEED
jgi:hypothetical protein